MAILPVGIGPQEGGYQIERSLRFNSADSAYLSRTPASAGNRKTWTISVWIKRTNPGTENWVYDGGSTSNSSGFQFTDTNLLRVLSTSSSGAVDDLDIRTTQVFRDPSAWYHIVLAVDTTQATSTNRVKLYVNGSQVTAFGTANYPTQNYDFGVNNNHSQKIGKWNISTGRDFDGYMADFYLVDGTQLDPTSFGEYNSETGVWQPKAYTGSYGTNGFYLDFADNSSTTALGYDAAGSNDWTPNNFSVTAGAGNDSLVDTPTPYGTDTGVGGEVRGNYATRNPLAASTTATGYPTNGNLDSVWSSGGSFDNAATMGFDATDATGYYWEYLVNGTALSRYPLVGVANSDAVVAFTGKSGGSAQPGSTSGGWMFENASGNKFNSGSATSYGTTTTSGWGCVAVKNGKIFIGSISGGVITWKNSGNPITEANPMFSGITGTVFPTTSEYSSGTVSYNFGQQAFQATAPSGFKALCTQNLPEPAIKQGDDYFNAKLWTGNGSTQSITGIGFQPDLVWTKDRGAAFDHTLFDAVRGATIFLRSNATSADETRTDSLTSFNSDGFSVGADAVRNNINKSSASYVSWAWKANGTGVTNTAGTITGTVTVSANTTAGFSIVTYTGNGTNGATVGHGLGVAPKLIIVKRRTTAGASWLVYHANMAATPQNNFLVLNATDAVSASALPWNNTAPTSTVITLGTSGGTNNNTDTFVAYVFAPVAGYSAFGSVSMNGSADGSFIYTGFLPKLVLLKRSDSTSNWIMWDTVRNTYNVVGAELYPNLSNAESTVTDLDILSNGFKMRNSGFSGTWIYAAWAEVPFRYSLAR